MRRRYEEELAELPATYRSAIGASLDNVQPLFREAAPRPMIFVGSGGALPVARLAADIHQRSTGLMAVARTPLEFVAGGPLRDAGLILFSSSGKHPDAMLTIAAARAAGYGFVGLVTSRPPDRLPAHLVSSGLRIAVIESPRDGFLATNSVLAMSTLVCRAYGAELSPTLPSLETREISAVGAQERGYLVLHGPGYASVAWDLETRLSEIGLGWTQVVDYRNLAHGRHVGLARRLPDAALIAFTAEDHLLLADRTLRLLPSSLSMIRLSTTLAFPSGVLDLLVASMRLVGEMAQGVRVDPGQPGVPAFGRKLYHLSLGRLVNLPSNNPVDRKLASAGLGREARTSLRESLRVWLDAIQRQTFRDVVLDYDGTCCPTHDRFRPPPEDVQNEILGILREGTSLTFASGRGRSLHESLKSWIPTRFWDSVDLGLYNGTIRMRLSDDFESVLDCQGDLAAAADRVESLELGVTLKVERRAPQVSVQAQGLTGAQLLPLVQSIILREPPLSCKAFASGHSVDILPSGAGKASLVGQMTKEHGPVLAIGDQGQPGGNDFELLAATPWSLSVDQCSPDPSRCWNLDEDGLRGPELLVRYLSALTSTGAALGFRWRRP